MKPLIKWPGGKSSEISAIEALIPPFSRYFEPFFGGGALFFHLQPRHAVLNDISSALMDFYRLVQVQDPELESYLRALQSGISGLQQSARAHLADLDPISGAPDIRAIIAASADDLLRGFGTDLILDPSEFLRFLEDAIASKLRRIRRLCEKKPFSQADLADGIVTGYMTGCYTYFRHLYNDMTLGRMLVLSPAYAAALFYFVREYCYGSMFRYNAAGEFNIPYGGKTYNKKDFSGKIDRIFSKNTEELLKNVTLCSQDFRDLFSGYDLTPHDFLFLDPPYDTEFSDYEGRAFGQEDQCQLADFLRTTHASFILVIKNTPFIQSLYQDGFHIRAFDNSYAYNVKSRNNRNVEHLIIANFPI